MMPHGGHGGHPGMPQAPLGSTPAQVQVTPQAGTSVNIAIMDSKDFPTQVAPINELFSEFSMMDGTALFECPGLMKQTGIDLMNCPLTVVLQLRIRRRMPQGPMVLWHVVLPLPLISKHLMSPPHEWETWIGLFPNQQDLGAHPADMMFTQAVHLISRPEFPKLRLRFTYHNPQLQAQALAQQEAEEKESKRRQEQTEQVGRQQFQDIHNLMKTFRESGNPAAPPVTAAAVASTAPAEPTSAPGPVRVAARPVNTAGVDPLRETRPAAVAMPKQQPQQTPAVTVSRQPLPAVPQAPPQGVIAKAQPPASAAPSQPAGDGGYPASSGSVAPSSAVTVAAAVSTVPASAATVPPSMGSVPNSEESQRQERMRDALAGSLRFVTEVRSALAAELAKRPQSDGTAGLPPQFDGMEVLSGSKPAAAFDAHCQHLRQCLQGVLAAAAASQAQPASPKPALDPMLLEGLRMASTGRLDDADGKDQRFMSVHDRFPQFWELCREVSNLAKERHSLVEMQQRTQDQCRQLQEQCTQISQERDQLFKEKENQSDTVTRGETQKQFEKLLNQQRQALQSNFDSETKALRQQLEEMRRTAQERESEVSQLRSQLEEFLKSRQK